MSADSDAAMAELEVEVSKDTDVKQSAITALTGLKAMLDAAGTDPAKLRALSASLGATTQGLADSIVANTPAAP